jgi:hypothetical protein
LSTHLRLGLHSGLFPSGFPTNILYAFLPHSCYMSRPSRPSGLDPHIYPDCLKCILTLSSHLRLGLPVALFSRFAYQNVSIPVLCHAWYMSWQSHFAWRNRSNNIYEKFSAYNIILYLLLLTCHNALCLESFRFFCCCM